MTLQIFAVMDGGRLHIAADEKYQGAVGTYNTWFTKFFAWLFGMSLSVSVNEKEYTVNKRSYIQLLQSLGVGSVTNKTIQAFKNFSRISFNPVNNGYMRQHLTIEKVRKLWEEMVQAMVEKEDINASERLLGEGADPNMSFCAQGFDGRVVFGQNPEAHLILPQRAIDPFQEGRYTPLLYATKKNYTSLRDTLLKFGADQTLRGMECMFERRAAYVPIERVEGSTLWVGAKPMTTIGIGGHRRDSSQPEIVTTRHASFGESLQSVKQRELNKESPLEHPIPLRDVRSSMQEISFNPGTKNLEVKKLPFPQDNPFL